MYIILCPGEPLIRHRLFTVGLIGRSDQWCRRTVETSLTQIILDSYIQPPLSVSAVNMHRLIWYSGDSTTLKCTQIGLIWRALKKWHKKWACTYSLNNECCLCKKPIHARICTHTSFVHNIYKHTQTGTQQPGEKMDRIPEFRKDF